MIARNDAPTRGERLVGVRWPRLLALALLLGAVGAIAYLDRLVAGAFDLTLLYFALVLTAAMLLPRTVAVAMAAAVAVVSMGISGASGLTLWINGGARLVLYSYVALVVGYWEQERRRLHRVSRIDELTGLYNLRALREQMPVWLGPAARGGRPMSVLVLDIDGFKAVNDRLGHGVGNELLREVATVLRFATRVGDAVFRLGGDEFVILLSDTGAPGAEAVARRIQQVFEEKGQTLRQTPLRVTFSMGLAVYPQDGQGSDDLLTHADEALYLAKANRRGDVMRYQAPGAAA